MLMWLLNEYRCFEERAGKSEWALESNAKRVGSGVLLFHYNHPYCDIAMDTPRTCCRARVVEFIDAQSVCLMRVV